MAQDASPRPPEDERQGERSREDRESIWSIPAKYKRWYFGLFTVQVIIAASWMIRTAIADDTLPTVAEKVLLVWQGMAPMAITSAAFSLVMIDSWGTTMVIASWLEETLEKRRQRQIKAAENAGVVRGRAEAAAEVQQKWEEWNERREDAAAAGEEFNEPPPRVASETEEAHQ